MKKNEKKEESLFQSLKRSNFRDFTKLPNKHWILAATVETTTLPTNILVKIKKKKDVVELLEKRPFNLSTDYSFFKGRWNKRTLHRSLRNSEINKPLFA
ncbi:MAG: hypothetical protein EOP10_31080, partial [Proteobacteria bacterium]